jgi:hypothetical protein
MNEFDVEITKQHLAESLSHLNPKKDKKIWWLISDTLHFLEIKDHYESEYRSHTAELAGLKTDEIQKAEINWWNTSNALLAKIPEKFWKDEISS